MELLVKLLSKITDAGLATLRGIRVNASLYDSTEQGFEAGKAFQDFLALLARCQSLRSLEVELTVSHIFYFDIDALRAYFMDNLALNSPGLGALAITITCLLEQCHVYLNIYSSRGVIGEDGTEQHDEQSKGRNNVLRFASSGMRQAMLFLQISERL